MLVPIARIRRETCANTPVIIRCKTCFGIIIPSTNFVFVVVVVCLFVFVLGRPPPHPVCNIILSFIIINCYINFL